MEHLHLPQEVDVHRQPPDLEDSPGVSNHAELEEDFESPSAEPNEPEETESRFATIGRSLEDLAVAEIFHFTLLSDFFHPSSNDRPIIIRDPEGLFCIDGWELVEEARNAGLATISCEVDTLAVHAEEELCLRKAAIRSATRGGKGEYMENARNARDLRLMLLASNDSLQELGHGGQRRGEGFVANSEDNVRHVIAKRLGKDPSTINTYFSHLEYLSDPAVNVFISRGAKKQFFEKAQKQKKILLKTYREDESSEEEIIQNVSSLMIALFNRQSESRSGSRRSRPAATSRETLTFDVPLDSAVPVQREEEPEGDLDGNEAPDDFSEHALAEGEQEDVIFDDDDVCPDEVDIQASSESIVEESPPDEELDVLLSKAYTVSEGVRPEPPKAAKSPRVIELEFADEIIQVLYVIGERYEDLMADMPLAELESILRDDISTLQILVNRIQDFRKK